MPDTQLRWQSAEASRTSALLAHAPFHTVVLTGSELRLESADEPFLAALGEGAQVGAPAREALGRALGDDWIGRIDAARTDGASHQGTRTLDGRLWDVWAEPLGDGAVALYGREIASDRHVRELLHALRNPIYGIRAAVKILLRRETSEETREVLEHIDAAAGQAEQHVSALERAR